MLEPKSGSFRSLRVLLPSLAALAVLSAAAKNSKPEAELSDAILAPRPAGGEYFGLYLLGKKVGYAFSDVSFVPGSKTQVRAVSELMFKASVGKKVSERFHKETRIYAAKPGGRLLSFAIEDRGDGGNQTLQGTATSAGIEVIQKRPGQADQTLHLKATGETVEDADQARVAIRRNKAVEGTILDGQDLQDYRATTTLGPTEQRFVRGIKLALHKVTTVSAKENVPIDAFVTDKGELVEMTLSSTMRAVSEPASVAKSLELVEVFGLTRVELPKALPENARKIPGSFAFAVAGLPEKFQKNTYRQQFKKLPGDRVEVKISASAPKLTKPASRPVSDPGGGDNLKSTIIVEADHPGIKAQARKIVGDEKDAYLATKKIVQWVGDNLKKEYGASADRASDVLLQMKGDCTEHSLLSVAMMRAEGIPARRIDGLVYIVTEDGVPALYWHEWVEAFVGEWTQLDPTFNQQVADATHFALGEESNAEITPLIGQLKVVEIL